MFLMWQFVGIWFEERDLVRTFGDRYRLYREQTGMLLPKPRPHSAGGSVASR